MEELPSHGFHHLLHLPPCMPPTAALTHHIHHHRPPHTTRMPFNHHFPTGARSIFTGAVPSYSDLSSKAPTETRAFGLPFDVTADSTHLHATHGRRRNSGILPTFFLCTYSGSRRRPPNLPYQSTTSGATVQAAVRLPTRDHLRPEIAAPVMHLTLVQLGRLIPDHPLHLPPFVGQRHSRPPTVEVHPYDPLRQPRTHSDRHHAVTIAGMPHLPSSIHTPPATRWPIIPHEPSIPASGQLAPSRPPPLQADARHFGARTIFPPIPPTWSYFMEMLCGCYLVIAMYGDEWSDAVVFVGRMSVALYCLYREAMPKFARNGRSYTWRDWTTSVSHPFHLHVIELSWKNC